MSEAILKTKVCSKTFFLGEYGVLTHGRAIVYAHDPFFLNENIQLKSKETELAFTQFHPKSPAGLLLEKYKKKSGIVFKDPHDGVGGFGGSTAEFLLVAESLGFLGTGTDENIHSIWKKYLSLHLGVKPSGADVAVQAKSIFMGKGLYLFCSTPFKVEKLDWPFKELTISVSHTGHKLKTHEHLNKLSSKLNPGAFKQVGEHVDKAVESALQALKTADLGLLKEAFLMQENVLVDNGLICKNSISLLEELRINLAHNNEVVKACGAMGSDTILSFHNIKSC